MLSKDGPKHAMKAQRGNRSTTVLIL